MQNKEKETININQKVPRDLWAEVRSLAIKERVKAGKVLAKVLEAGIPIVKAEAERQT